MSRAFLTLFLLALAASGRADDWNTVDPAYKHAPPEAYEKWRDLKYGLRIHWGIYSQWGVEASWPVRRLPDDKKQEYFDLYKTFNPKDFDAEKWMALLERCGFTNFTITTKHHDGFCMFDTKTRVKRRVNYAAPGGPRVEECDITYSVMDAPIKRDLVKELCDAARKHGIAIDMYFSHIDWFDADFRMDKRHTFHDPKFTSRDHDPQAYDRMVRRHRQQIKELLTEYGPIDMMCLDIRLPDFCWPDLKETIMMARRLQPNCLFRQRGIGAYGDYSTPEGWVPKSPDESRLKTPTWMAIDPLGKTFAYERDGTKYRSGEWILSNLVDIVSKGGNFQVAIGPDEHGDFHPEAVAKLEYVGDWLKVNGEAIYKTRPWKAYTEEENVRFTRSKDSRYVYAIALAWPGEEFRLTRVRAKEGTRITMLGYDKPLAWRQNDSGLVIDLPGELQDASKRPCVQAWAFRIEGAADEPDEGNLPVRF